MKTEKCIRYHNKENAFYNFIYSPEQTTISDNQLQDTKDMTKVQQSFMF